jgi:hypothetical protein
MPCGLPDPGQPIGRPPAGCIVMTPYLPPNYYPFSVPLIMEFSIILLVSELTVTVQ